MKTVNIHLLSFQVEVEVVVGGGGWFLVTKPHRRCFYSKSFMKKMLKESGWRCYSLPNKGPIV